MANPENAGAGGSRRGDGGRRKSIRFSDEQVEALEMAFNQCPHPSASQRREMKRMFPVLSHLDDTLLKVWFQNHRNFTRLQKDSDVHLLMERLIITNKILKEENATLKKKVTELISENDFLWQQLHEAI